MVVHRRSVSVCMPEGDTIDDRITLEGRMRSHRFEAQKYTVARSRCFVEMRQAVCFPVFVYQSQSVSSLIIP